MHFQRRRGAAELASDLWRRCSAVGSGVCTSFLSHRADCNREQMCCLETFYLLSLSKLLLFWQHWLSGALHVYSTTDSMVRSLTSRPSKVGVRGSVFTLPVQGRQDKQNGRICFACENQWSQTDGGVLPHYLLPTLTNAPPPPPPHG